MASINQFSPQDRIVVVLGPSGAGKSTFIDRAIKGNGEGISHGLRAPKTERFRAYSYSHPTDNHPIVFVDTPGFDEECTPTTTVLYDLGRWLEIKYKQHVDVALVIYLHKIGAKRMSESLVRSIQSIKDFQIVPNVVIATTMWSEVSMQIGERREKELEADFREELVHKYRVERFDNTGDSAWGIVGHHPLQDRIVVVLGAAGAGKSTFIDCAIGGSGRDIRHGLSPSNLEFKDISYPHPKDGYRVTFVDTSGIDEEPTIFLAELSEWLKKKYTERDRDAATIIYLHKINANRLGGSLQQILLSIKDFQTDSEISNLVIATTMWSEVDKIIAEERERVLKEDFWRVLGNNGPRFMIERFDDTYDSAWKIIGKLAVRAQDPSKKGRIPKFTESILLFFKNMLL